MSLLNGLRAAFGLPIVLAAKVTRTPLRQDGRHAASVEISNGVSAYILTPRKLTVGDEVRVKLATNGWELA